ncbi:MAG: hypothetical protein ACP5KN_02270 [Armatimonadota bacterium]
MTLTAQQVRDFAKAAGADLCGIANMERFEGAPAQMDPRYIFPEARSAVVIGRRIPRGVYRGIEEGTHWSNYTVYGYNRLNTWFMPKAQYETACFIEDHAFEAVPVYPGVPEAQPRLPAVRDGQPGPDVYPQVRIAAVAAGLGEIGWSKVFLSGEFGPRQRLCMILTDAELEPDPLVEPNSICNLCMDCVRECPGHCIPHISEGKTVEIQIEDTTYRWGDVDMGKCCLTHHGLNKEASPFLAMDCPGLRMDVSEQECSEEEAYKLTHSIGRASWRKTDQFPSGHVIDYAWTMLHGVGYYAVCGARGCIRACFMSNGPAGDPDRRFHNGFRKRPMWTLSPEGEVGVAEE